VALDPARAASARKLERKLDQRRAELRDRAQEAEKLARARRERALLRTAPFDVRIGTFNVLGSQHTAPGGERRNYPPASYRSPAQADFINAKALDIVGMQELQDDQLTTISARTGLTAWPGFAWGAKETDNSILYDADRFELVSGEMWTIPFMGRPRPQPIVRLRVRDTGREFYVVNTHPSAGYDRKYTAERYHGQDVLIGVLSRLTATGLPVLLTGDMNDRAPFYDRVVCRGGMVSASGGSGCASRPPQMYAVDWVVGSPAVSFTDYVSDPGPGDRKLTDHFVVYATAHVG
jgi:endonuclease/exonuclease/phosphatase family metal-dependent hydrolase